MFDNIGSAVKEIVKETEEAAEKTLIDAGKFAREAALKTTKFKVSDTFRQATQFQRVDKLSGFVLADKPYAIYLEEGTRAHQIIARNAKCLHFVVNGEHVFTKSVNHPGNKAYWFMEDARKELDANIGEMFFSNLSKILKE